MAVSGESIASAYTNKFIIDEAAAGATTTAKFYGSEGAVTFAVTGEGNSVASATYTGDEVELSGITSTATTETAFASGASKAITVKSAAYNSASAVTITKASDYNISFDSTTANVVVNDTSNVTVTGSTAADTFTLGAKVASGTTVKISGGENSGDDGDTFTAESKVNSGTVIFSGTGKADVFNVSGITGDGTTKLYGNGGADTYNIANAKVSIVAGTDNELFNFSGTAAVEATLATGLNVGDSIKVGTGVSNIELNATKKVLTFTAENGPAVTLTLDSEYNSDLDGVSVNGETKTKLGDWVNPHIWSATNTAGTYTYGKKLEISTKPLFSATGLSGIEAGSSATGVTGASVDDANGTVTITSEAFTVDSTGNYNTITAGGATTYKLKMAPDKSTTTLNNAFRIEKAAASDKTTTALFYETANVTFAVTGDGDSVASANFNEEEVKVELKGILSSTKISNLTSGTNKITVASAAYDAASAVTIATASGYNITFSDTAANVIVNDTSDVTVTGSSAADTFALGANVASDKTVNISGGANTDGGDIFTVADKANSGTVVFSGRQMYSTSAV